MSRIFYELLIFKKSIYIIKCIGILFVESRKFKGIKKKVKKEKRLCILKDYIYDFYLR